MSLIGGLVKTVLPYVPRSVVGRVAARYVAGETLAAALDTVRLLNSGGACTTVDILGESIAEASAARAAVEQYSTLIQAIASSGLDSTVSLKPTMLGLLQGKDACRENLETLYRLAQELRVVLTIDMEDSTTTDATLGLFGEMQQRYGNAGCVLQAYLRRTRHDIEALPAGSNVRLCKGIYVEPRERAYKEFQEIRGNFLECLRDLFAAGHYVGIATHDDWLVDRALSIINSLGLSHEQYEFQMLLGVREKLRYQILDAGHRLRVYVPYGRDWYAYSIRRLRENPAVAIHVIKAMLGMG
ncbi:proline dehydrogenase family protein [bacterium]|nr:proline dehydrogenase family protein [bacterium]